MREGGARQGLACGAGPLELHLRPIQRQSQARSRQGQEGEEEGRCARWSGVRMGSGGDGGGATRARGGTGGVTEQLSRARTTAHGRRSLSRSLELSVTPVSQAPKPRRACLPLREASTTSTPAEGAMSTTSSEMGLLQDGLSPGVSGRSTCFCQTNDAPNVVDIVQASSERFLDTSKYWTRPVLITASKYWTGLRVAHAHATGSRVESELPVTRGRERRPHSICISF